MAAAATRAMGSQSLPPHGRLVRTLPVGRLDGRPAPPLGVLLGRGLDARQFTDLSRLSPEALLTPTAEFYVRTAASAAHRARLSPAITIAGRVTKAVTIGLRELEGAAGPRGAHVLECAGNADPANFGLMSLASWSGVPLEAVLDRVTPWPGATLVQVTGFDDDSVAWESSQSGASWILTRDDIRRTGAFLATAMNDAPLTADHGAPVRLVVPNWFGCASIKWVTDITMLGDDAPATSQMREFAARTHQEKPPGAARDYHAPVVDLAAFPLRVEQWVHDGRTSYRVVGVRWGGTRPDAALAIRFKHTEPFVPVESSPAPSSPTTWGLWTHTWRPEGPGRYQIALKPLDFTVPARRLELFFYTREVEVVEV